MKTVHFGLLLALAPIVGHPCSAQTPETVNGAPTHGADQRLLVPLNTNFWSYWTHYWTTWLPEHPVYEMIELTAYEDPSNPEGFLIRLFLTEREGSKRQYFYLNDREAVERTRANAYHRDITYRRLGSPGGPQGLHVAFVDKDSIPVEWTINFDDETRLRDHGNGLTPSIHSLGSILLFALRTRTADTHDDQVLFAGQDYAHQGAADDTTRGTRSWYNPDYYSAIVLFGRQEYTQDGAVLSNSWGRTFAPVDGQSGLYRSGSLGPDNYVQFEVDGTGAMKSYAHFSHGHSLDFQFDPPLPTLDAVRDEEEVRFSVAFDGGRNLMAGDVHIHRNDEGSIVLEWIPAGPEWAIGRDFYSVVVPNAEGYELTLTDDRAVAFPTR